MIGMGGMLSVDDVDITTSNLNYRGQLSDIYIYYNITLGYSTCANTDTTQTNGVYHPTESGLLLIEDS